MSFNPDLFKSRVSELIANHPYIFAFTVAMFGSPIIEGLLKKLGLPGLTDFFYRIGVILSALTSWMGLKIHSWADVFREYFSNLGRILLALGSMIINPIIAFVDGLRDVVWSLPSKFGEWYNEVRRIFCGTPDKDTNNVVLTQEEKDECALRELRELLEEEAAARKEAERDEVRRSNKQKRALQNQLNRASPYT